MDKEFMLFLKEGNIARQVMLDEDQNEIFQFMCHGGVFSNNKPLKVVKNLHLMLGKIKSMDQLKPGSVTILKED